MIAKSLSTSERRARLYVEAEGLAEFCQALYPLIVAHADDWGRLEGSAFHVKHAIEPASPRSLEQFAAALGALDKVGLIAWYVVDDRKYIEVNDFKKHQPGLKVRGESTCPPRSAVKCREVPQVAAKSMAVHGKPSLTELNLTELNRTELKGTELPQAAPARSHGGPPMSMGLRRFKVWRWMLDDLIDKLGDQAVTFDLEGWLLELDARDNALVQPKTMWEWLQSEFFAEVQRRGIPMAQPVALQPTNKRIAGLVAGGNAFLARNQS